MQREPDRKTLRNNLLLIGAAVLFVALAFTLCMLLRPRSGGAGTFVIRTRNGQSVTVGAGETRTIVIRNGAFAEEATGEGEENVIRIENGQARMLRANCPHGDCVEQGVLSAETAETRPLGAWIICMPHGVTVEYRGSER